MNKYYDTKSIFSASIGCLLIGLVFFGVGGRVYAANTGFKSVGTVETSGNWSLFNTTRLGASDNSRSNCPNAANCDSTTAEDGEVSDFTFNIPAGATIDGIVVRMEGGCTNSTNCSAAGDLMEAALSWDDGVSWTTIKQTTELGTTEASYDLGGSSDTWGRTWSVSEFANGTFRLSVGAECNNGCSSSANDSIFLDYVAVDVYYTEVADLHVTGNAYAGDNTEDLSACDGSTQNIAVVVGTTTPGKFAGSCADSGNAYDITLTGTESLSADVPIIAYIDGVASTYGSSLVLHDGSGNQTGLTVRQNRLVVSSDTATAITNANLDKWDNGNDTDMPYTVTSSNLTVEDGIKLVVNTSDTFTPGGMVTTDPASSQSGTDGDLTISSGATLSMGTNALSVGGDFYNAGTFSKSSGQVTTFTATGADFLVLNSSGNFDSLVFNGSGGDWTMTNTMTIDGDITVTAGTLKATTSSITITVNGGDVTGNGTINITGGVFLLDGEGLFGGSGNWTFDQLTFGDGSGVATTTSQGSGSVTTATTTIAADQILDAGVSKDWTLTAAHEPFQLAGTLLASSSTFIYTSASNATVTPATYYNIELLPTSGSPTYKLATTSGSTLTVQNNFTIAGTGNVTVDANTRDPGINIDGNLSIGSGDIFNASNSATLSVGGNFSNNGTFTHNNGTLAFNDAAKVTTITSSGDVSFYNISVTTPGKYLEFEAHGGDNVPIFSFDNDLTVTGASGNLVQLRSATPGSQWLVDFNTGQSAIVYAFIRDAACATGSLSVAYSGTNSGGGNNGSCWNIGNVGADGAGVVTSVEGGSGGGNVQTGGGHGGGGGGSGSDGGGGGGEEQGGGGQGGGGGGGGSGGSVLGASTASVEYLLHILENLELSLTELSNVLRNNI